MPHVKLKLPTVTLITVHGVDPDAATKVLRYCMQYVEFASVKLVSSREPKTALGSIEMHQIEAIDYWHYSQFVMNHLSPCVDTQHCLLVQTDGFITNPGGWEDSFLDYDYIGAPWPSWAQWCPVCRVGNGGFSLRSKKLLELTASLHFDGGNEDYVITNNNYDHLMRHGIRIAPVDVAARFSCELPCDDVPFDPSTSFGFHGKQYTENLSRLELFEGESPLEF